MRNALNKEYLEHSVFRQLTEYADFYRLLSDSIMSWISQETNSAINIDTYVFSSIQGNKSIFASTFQNNMNRIKEVLEEKGVKQTWLAEQLGKSYNMVNGYVQNRQQPRLEILFEIAEILGVNPKDLIQDKNDKHTTKS